MEQEASNSNKSEEIILLEKQGRSSQKIRNNGMGNLAQVSQSVGQNMTDISHIGTTPNKVSKFTSIFSHKYEIYSFKLFRSPPNPFGQTFLFFFYQNLNPVSGSKNCNKHHSKSCKYNSNWNSSTTQRSWIISTTKCTSTTTS